MPHMLKTDSFITYTSYSRSIFLNNTEKEEINQDLQSRNKVMHP